MDFNGAEKAGVTLDYSVATSEAMRSWALVEKVLTDEAVLGQLGFSGRKEVEDAVIIHRAGDRLHPTKGFDFLGPGWVELDKEILGILGDERDKAVEQIYQEFLKTLESGCYEAARQYVWSASKYQVLSLSRSPEETVNSILQMQEVGVGKHEYSQDLLGKCGNCLVIDNYELISYFAGAEVADAGVGV